MADNKSNQNLNKKFYSDYFRVNEYFSMTVLNTYEITFEKRRQLPSCWST